MTLYFAYGSNLNLGQMQRRCPAATPLDKLYLPDAKLVFRGVADVVFEEGSTAPGGIWRLTPACEAALDRYEGWRPDQSGMYRKEYVEVEGLPDGETEIMIYVMNSEGIYPPSDGYYRGIVQGYKDFGLDKAALKAALKHSYDAKHPSHIERKRTRRMGRPALAPRPLTKAEREADAAREKAYRAAERPKFMDGDKHRNSLKQVFHDPWANVPADQRRKKVMNLDQWLRDRKSSGDRY